MAGYMSAYQENVITMDPSTFKDNAEVVQTDTKVVPTKGAVVKANFETRSLFRILCKCLFSEVTVQAVTELDNKAAHCHSPVLQRHRPFLGRRLDCQPHHFFHRVVCREHFTLFDRMADHAV